MREDRLPFVAFRVVFCVVLAAASRGCGSTATQVAPTAIEPKTPVVASRWESVGTSVAGRPIEAWFGGQGERRALFLGAIHGDERASRAPLATLIEHLETRPEVIDGWRLVVIPVANPDGFEKNTRENLNGINLNRNFPTDNFRPSRRHGKTSASEPEVQALIKLIDRHTPEVIVSLHGPLACVDYDGPASGLAGRMSQACGLRVKRLGAMPGSLGSYAGLERGIPTITLELGREGDRDTTHPDRILPALLAVFDEEQPSAAK